MTKTSQDNNLDYINFLKHFYEYHIEKLKSKDVQYTPSMMPQGKTPRKDPQGSFQVKVA